MLSEKFQSLFSQSYTPGEGWNDYSLFSDVIPKEVAKSSLHPSKLPLCSWTPDSEMIDSLGIRAFLEAHDDKDENVQSPRDNAKESPRLGEQRDRSSGPGTSRKTGKSCEKKKDAEKPEVLFKTEICKQWKDGKSCKFGKKCHFAHGIEELRDKERHKKFKTVLCQKWHTTGSCCYGSRCSFIHDEPYFSQDHHERLNCFQKRHTSELPVDVHSSVVQQFKNMDLF